MSGVKEKHLVNDMELSRKYLNIFIVLRFILGGVFVYAAIGKILDPYEFAVNIRNYELLPDSLSNLLAIILPWLELLCGVLLIAGIWNKSSALFISAMMIIFILAISSAMFRGLDIDCGCYKGIAESGKIGWIRLLEDVLLLLISAGIVFKKTLLEKLSNRN